MELKDQLLSISESVTHLLPELILIASLVITLVLGLLLKKQQANNSSYNRIDHVFNCNCYYYPNLAKATH
jgi:hypothetical protein